MFYTVLSFCSRQKHLYVPKNTEPRRRQTGEGSVGVLPRYEGRSTTYDEGVIVRVRRVTSGALSGCRWVSTLRGGRQRGVGSRRDATLDSEWTEPPGTTETGETRDVQLLGTEKRDEVGSLVESELLVLRTTHTPSLLLSQSYCPSHVVSRFRRGQRFTFPRPPDVPCPVRGRPSHPPPTPLRPLCRRERQV